MTEIIERKYVAEDGKIFFDKEECEKYETELVEKRFSHIHLFNIHKEPICLAQGDDAWYAYIEKECSEKELQAFKDCCENYKIYGFGCIDTWGFYSMESDRIDCPWFNIRESVARLERLIDDLFNAIQK